MFKMFYNKYVNYSYILLYISYTFFYVNSVQLSAEGNQLQKTQTIYLSRQFYALLNRVGKKHYTSRDMLFE